MTVTTIVDAEIDGGIVDVRVEGGRIAAVGVALTRRGTHVVEAKGGALIPGLHDHHIHLLAMAAAERSIDLSGRDSAAIADAIAVADRLTPKGAWLRAVAYDDSLAGRIDASRLDRLAPGRPVRVQHRSGAAWVLSSAAQRELGLDPTAAPDGWLHRGDELLARRDAPDAIPDLRTVGLQLATLGVTGVTDATPFADQGGFNALAAARRSGELPQHVVVTGGPGLAGATAPDGLALGPVKIVVADNALPTVHELIAAFTSARNSGRPVAVHCVSAVGLALALVAWEEVGSVDGDRIEHGSVIAADLIARVADLGLTVVTQPGFVAARGDHYRADVDADELPGLYRCRSLIDAGVPVGGSTDAPFGPADPWLAIRTAVDRCTAGGHELGPGEALDPRRALGLFLTPPDRPGGVERRVTPGASADLCLLGAPLQSALADPSASVVRATWIGGVLAAGRP